MDLQLNGKLALVSGSTAGIGYAIAAALAGEGARVIVNGRTQDSVDRVMGTLRAETGREVLGFAGDLSLAEAAEELARRYPGVEILVNNLGIFEPKPFGEIDDADWRRFFEVNVLSGVRLARLFLPAMKRADWGRIIFISSESAVQIPAEMIHYGVTKTAQIAVARGLAEDVAGTGITVNSVLPGPTRSRGVNDFVGQLAQSSGQSFEAFEKEFFEKVRPTSLIKRFATPAEVASLVAYIASPLASATTARCGSMAGRSRAHSDRLAGCDFATAAVDRRFGTLSDRRDVPQMEDRTGDSEMGGDAMSEGASANPTHAMINKGFFVLNAGATGGGGRTFIVTGQQRSGTSLVAAVLRQVGVFMGAEINDQVHEDEAIARILTARDRDGLQRVVGERNADFGTWGFKFPMLNEVLEPTDMGLFTNPHVVVPVRDPVAVAVRRTLSEFHQPMAALGEAAKDLAAMLGFVERLECPVLLLSYEKSLVFPADFVDAIVRFGDLPQGEALRARLIALIEPNRKEYIDTARLQYFGLIERVAGGFLCGWSRLSASADPVPLELLADDRPVLTFRADEFRQDLLDGGYGTGRHGFRIDLGTLCLRPDAVIRVRVAGHGIELDNSGRPLAAYQMLP